MELADFIGPATGAGSIIETVTGVLGDVGPYVLGLFALTVAVSIGMALLGRTKRQVVGAIK